MRKVAVVQPVAEGFAFNITTETNVQLVSFAYATRAEAEAAATHAQAVVRKSPFGCFHSSTRSLGADGGPFYWIGGIDETQLRPEPGRGLRRALYFSPNCVISS